MVRESSIKRSIVHFAHLSDTDILPPLFEFRFFMDCADTIASRLKSLNFSDYKPKSCFEVLSPKTRLSFRIAHQLYPTDTLLYTAAVIDIAPQLEKLRLPIEDGPFSYRFIEDAQDHQLFSESGNYHDWLLKVQEICKKDGPFSDKPIVIETDISDFYPRIYFHRVEHVLDDCEAENAVRKIIEGIIKFSRARQSHGLPVGSSASRILAEGILNDTDRLLHNRDIPFVRYVDDFRIVVKTEQDAHSTLCRLAEHLMLTEGLSLNASKTNIWHGEQLNDAIENRLTDVFTTSEFADLNKYFARIYDGEDVSVEDIEGVDSKDLINKLGEILKRDIVDYASVKVILKALRAVDVDDPVEIVKNFGELIYYVPRDFCILVGALAQKYPEFSEDIADQILAFVVSKPLSDMALSRIWVAHLFVSQALPITHQRLQSMPLIESVIERRQALLLKGLLNDRAYFREKKTRFDEASDWEKPALLLAAGCLPKSEYETWLSLIKAQHNDILSEEYFKWLKLHRGDIKEILRYDFAIKNRADQLSSMLPNSDDIDDIL